MGTISYTINKHWPSKDYRINKVFSICGEIIVNFQNHIYRILLPY